MIEAELQKFYDSGYIHKESDLRWCHVLQDMSNNLFLADLGSLEKYNDSSEENFVETQVNYKLYLRSKVEIVNDGDRNDSMGKSPAENLDITNDENDDAGQSTASKKSRTN